MLAAPLSSFADVQQLVGEGIALYDAGRYDEAVTKFKAALEEDPSSELAAYELGMTYHAKGDTVECQALLEPRGQKKGKFQAQTLTILGNCYDMGGDPKRAVAAYRKALKINGNDTMLLYNLAVTLAGQGEGDEARALLKKELTISAAHPSGQLLLAHVFEAQSFRAPAALAYLRFLSQEPAGERAKEAATRVLSLLGMGVEKKSEGNINVTIDVNGRKEEGDYGAFEMMMALSAAAQFTEENVALSQFERARNQVSVALSMLVEGKDGGRDYTHRQNVPFFRALAKNKLIDVFSGVAVSSLALDGTEAWFQQNEAPLNTYLEFMKGTK